MSYSFNPERGLVVVQAEVFGPSGSIVLRLALDTGATATMISVAPLTAVGYDPSLSSDRVQVTYKNATFLFLLFGYFLIILIL